MGNIIGLSLAIMLALVHIFASRTEWLSQWPRRWWISFAGGISIAYIFLDILPELDHAQKEIEHGINFLMQYLESHVYLLALAGLTIFYGLEKLALKSRQYNQKITGKNITSLGIFWVHIISFGLYNLILGYLLREAENHGLQACLILFVALAMHFIVNDVRLREHHQHAYDQMGRWLLAAAILVGWTWGQAVQINAAAIAAIWAFVAGGIILNVLKEELPEEQESHFGMFVFGAGVYSIILLAL